MEQKIYFDVEKISVIEIRGEKLLAYEFFPEEQSKRIRRFFGLLLPHNTEYPPARWSSDGGRFYTTDEQMRGYSFYRIDEKNKKVYNRAQVTVHLGYKEMVSKLFDTTEEAIEWGNHVIEASGKKLELVIDK